MASAPVSVIVLVAPSRLWAKLHSILPQIFAWNGDLLAHLVQRRSRQFLVAMAHPRAMLLALYAVLIWRSVKVVVSLVELFLALAASCLLWCRYVAVAALPRLPSEVLVVQP